MLSLETEISVQGREEGCISRSPGIRKTILQETVQRDKRGREGKKKDWIRFQSIAGTLERW